MESKAKTIPATITVDSYIDRDGNPCCAKNFETGEVCRFYQSGKFGVDETCFFAETPVGKRELLGRRKNGFGTLIPMKSCPIWGDKEL